MKFGDLLLAFKKQEQDSVENVITVIDNPILRNGLLAWQSMTVDYDSDLDCIKEDSKKQWEWMWENVKFDYKKFAQISGVKEYEAPSVIERLKAFKLIYPDGTSNVFARAFIRKLVSEKLPMKKDKKDAE